MSGYYVFATTEDRIRWYKYDSSKIEPGAFEVVDVLDLSVIPTCVDKPHAKQVAKKLGLKSWRYVKIG